MNGTEEPWSKWQTISTKCHQCMLLVGEAMLYLTSCMLGIQIVIPNYWHQHFLLAFSLYQHIGIPETAAWTSPQQNLQKFFLSSLPCFFFFLPPLPLSFFFSFFLACLSICLFWQNLAVWLRLACHSYGVPRLQACACTPSRGLWFGKMDISSAFLGDNDAACFRITLATVSRPEVMVCYLQILKVF